MSLELYAFVNALPDRQGWQLTIDEVGGDLKLDPTLDVRRDSGFWPCQLRGRSSGFELSMVGAAEVLQDQPSLKTRVGTRSHVMCFRWGGELAECACVLGATLALVHAFGAVVYDPADDCLWDSGRLKRELGECLAGLT